MNWTGIPFVRFVFALASGIFFAHSFQPSFLFLTLISVLTLSLFLALHFFLPLPARLSWKSVKGGFALLFLFLTGNLLLVTRSDVWGNDHFQNFKDFGYYNVIIKSEPVESEKFYRAEAEVEKIFADGKWWPARGNVLLYFNRKEYPKPEPGELAVIKGMPELPGKAKNPGEFDFADFLKTRNIFYCHFLYKGQASFTGDKKSFFFNDLSISIRNYFLRKLNEKLPEKEASIAAGLLLGVKKDLPDELRENYNSSGLTHLLAVSGLHTGIIYQLLVMLLGPIRKRKTGRAVFVISCIAGLWMYALVTGLSASVLRASFMFSCFLIAGVLTRRPVPINTLALSAFFLLLLDPLLVFDVGFQLSYAAVAGILLILPFIQQTIPLSGKVSCYIRDMTGLTISAQAFTFPLGILYFHQFPIYFLFSNLIVVPVAVVCVYAGVLMLALAEIPVAGDLAAFILKYLLLFQEILVEFFASLPAPLIISSLSVPELVLVFLLVAMFLYFLKTRDLEIMKYLVFISLFFTAMQIVNINRYSDRNELIVWHIPGHSALAKISGQKAVIFADQSLLQAVDKQEMIRKSLLAYNVTSTEWSKLPSNNCRVLVKKGETGQLVLNLNGTTQQETNGIISVIDGYMKNKRKVKENRDAYHTSEKGALVLNLNIEQ